ncbi:polysaccharide biosynthesis/export family protein [Polaribacter sp.]|nr:polysaccharide biosynthesis/export family protein [Polaribacter sp.]
MHFKNYIILAFILLSLVSCSSNKILFKDIPENTSIKIPEAVITYGDLIDVNISSLNNQSTSIFSAQQSMDKIGTIRNAEARKLDGYLVDSSGNIDIPILGIVKVSGMTCSSLSESIKKDIKEYVLNPNVRIKILNFRVSILGQVTNPGTIEVINQNISFTELISRAGDLKKNADPTKVMLLRNVDNKVQTKYLDLTSNEFLNSEYYYLKQNDVVYVRPDNASLAFDFGILRNTAAYSFLFSIIILLTR